MTSWKNAFEKDPSKSRSTTRFSFFFTERSSVKTQGVSFVNSSMGWVNEQKFYASTDGSRIDQYIIRANPNFNVTAVTARTAISSRAVRSVVHKEWATSTSKSTTGNAKRSKRAKKR